MSLTITGNNEIVGVPLLERDQNPWPALLDRYDPALRPLGEIGLSAAIASMQSSTDPKKAWELAASEELFDEEGALSNRGLYWLITKEPDAETGQIDQFNGGLLVAKTALVASIFIGRHQVAADEYDLSEKVHVINRRASLDIPEENASMAGKTLVELGVKNLQASVVSSVSSTDDQRITASDSELGLTAILQPGKSRKRSTAMYLRGVISGGSVRAYVLEGENHGDILRIPDASEFSKLDRFARVMQDNMQTEMDA